MDYITKEIIYINSTNRTAGTSSNFSINVNEQLKYPNNYDRISLLAADIPKSYYLINANNNTFTVTESKTNTITIPVGNYSLTSMVTQLNQSLTGLSYTYVVTSSTQTGKITFTVSGGTPTFDFSGSSLYRILGFAKTSYTSTSLTSVNVVNFQLSSNIFVMCNLAEKSILSSIIPDSADYSTILYNEQSPILVSKVCNKVNVSDIKIWLLDGITGEQIDLNGLDFTIKVLLYKENTFYKTQLINQEVHKTIQDFTENVPDNIDPQ